MPADKISTILDAKGLLTVESRDQPSIRFEDQHTVSCQDQRTLYYHLETSKLHAVKVRILYDVKISTLILTVTFTIEDLEVSAVGL